MATGAIATAVWIATLILIAVICLAVVKPF